MFLWSEGEREYSNRWNCGECHVGGAIILGDRKDAQAHVQQTGHQVTVSYYSSVAIFPVATEPPVTGR